MTRVDENKKNSTETITQTQKFHLSAAYYEPLESLDNIDFENLNYQYIQLERSSEKVTQNNELILALSTEQGEFDKTTQEYRQGKLVNEDKEHNAYSQITDFTELAKQETEQQTRELLSTVMIDPYQKHQQDADKKPLKSLDGRLIRGLSGR